MEDDLDAESQSRLMKVYLVGRLLSVRPFNSSALITTLGNIWKTIKKMEAKSIAETCFLFKIQNRADADKVLGLAMVLHKHLFLLTEVGGEVQPRKQILETSLFWLHIYNLPNGAWRESLIRRLARREGEVQVEYSEIGEVRGRYAGVQIEILIREPLVRGTLYKVARKDVTFIPFKYERIQHFLLSMWPVGPC